MAAFEPPGDCPVCGEYVAKGAAACRHCGACPETGWNEETLYDGIDLPDDAFADGEAGAKPAGRKPRRGGVPRWAVAVAVALALVLLLWALGFG